MIISSTKIEKYIYGCHIEPPTCDEEGALIFILEALKDKYSVPIGVSSLQITNHLLLLDLTPSTENVV